MKSNTLSILLLLSVAVSMSCSSESVKPTSALVANSAIDNLTARPFDKKMLGLSGMNVLNEYIRADARSRVDVEAVGDADSGFDPATVDTSSVTIERSEGETGESAAEEPGSLDVGEDAAAPVSISEAKFHWVNNKFGENLKAHPSTTGMIVLYADENFFEINGLTRLIEEGRSRIAEKSGIPEDRIQVTYGGYRGVPQVEYWIVSEGKSMPELKPDDREKSSEPEN